MENSRKKNETLVYGVLIFLIIFLPFNRANAQVCTPPPANLVSWWPGDGNANDIVDGNPGALVNGATFAAGKVGQAFSFDGVDDFVTIGDPANLQITGDFTITAWINPNSVGRVHHILVRRAPACGQVGYGFALNPPNNVLDSNDGFSNITSGLLVPVNQFSFVAVVSNDAADTFDFYVNDQTTLGVPVASQLGNPSNANIQIGQANGCSLTTLFEGLIDEVSIYDRALSASEIQDIFDAGNAGMCKPLTILERIEDLESQVEALINHTHDYLTGKGKQHNDTEAVTGPANLE